MSPEMIAALAVMTYTSRALALAYLPPLPGRLATILDRMPPALFAGLAAHALIGPAGGLADAPVLAAAAGALVAAPLRSLPVCLATGLVAYAVVATLTGSLQAPRRMARGLLALPRCSCEREGVRR